MTDRWAPATARLPHTRRTADGSLEWATVSVDAVAEAIEAAARSPIDHAALAAAWPALHEAIEAHTRAVEHPDGLAPFPADSNRAWRIRRMSKTGAAPAALSTGEAIALAEAARRAGVGIREATPEQRREIARGALKLLNRPRGRPTVPLVEATAVLDALASAVTAATGAPHGRTAITNGRYRALFALVFPFHTPASARNWHSRLAETGLTDANVPRRGVRVRPGPKTPVRRS